MSSMGIREGELGAGGGGSWHVVWGGNKGGVAAAVWGGYSVFLALPRRQSFSFAFVWGNALLVGVVSNLTSGSFAHNTQGRSHRTGGQSCLGGGVDGRARQGAGGKLGLRHLITAEETTGSECCSTVPGPLPLQAHTRTPTPTRQCASRPNHPLEAGRWAKNKGRSSAQLFRSLDSSERAGASQQVFESGPALETLDWSSAAPSAAG